MSIITIYDKTDKNEKFQLHKQNYFFPNTVVSKVHSLKEKIHFPSQESPKNLDRKKLKYFSRIT